MKTAIYSILVSAFLGLSLLSCDMKSNLLPLAQGKEGEVLVVIDDKLWKGPCGDSIRHYLTAPVMGLPAPEPMFTLVQMSSLSDFMQKFRNIVIVRVDPGYEKAKLGYKSNVYAQNQLIFNLDAPSVDSVITCMDKNKDLISSHFLVKDRDSYIAYYQRIIAKPIVEMLHEKFQVDICVPKEYKLTNMETDDFVWLAREEGEKIFGILMWEEPYTAQSQLEPDMLIAKMNQMTKKYVQGPDEGSYMADEPTIPPVVKRFKKDDIYYVQMNGLWQTEKSFMGGPYVSLSMVDAKRGQIVTGVGFVFYPNREKRQYVRQLEAILYTMKPASENTQTQK